ncbi:hypothetical protein NMG60_11024363 [Bertholletia excelsa]
MWHDILEVLEKKALEFTHALKVLVPVTPITSLEEFGNRVWVLLPQEIRFVLSFYFILRCAHVRPICAHNCYNYLY